jgi:FkbM family methyltransferase
MRDRLLRLYAFLFARRPFRKWNQFLFDLSVRGLGVLNHETPAATGESWFLAHQLARRPRPVVFDVGSNAGQYAAEVLKVAPDAELHCFEPHPVSCAALTSRFGARATVNRVALGRAPGTATLYDYAAQEGSQHASVHKGVLESIHHADGVTAHQVPVETLAGYCAAKGIRRIDLLKIDTEGHELAVLEGLGDLLRPEVVRALHVEFNEMNVVSRVFFKDFWDRLSPSYKLFRLVRGGVVPIRRYSPLACELFAFQNVVAVTEGLR